jgi:glycosyltransferase involved in cell wall biosynthesis
MRVAFVIDGLAAIGGGITTYLRTVVPALTATGVECVLVAGQPADDPLPGAEYVTVPGVDADVAELPADVREALGAALAAARADVCFVHVISPDASRTAARHAPTFFFAHEYLTVCPGGSRYLQRRQRFCTEGPGLRCFWRAYTDRTTNRRPDRLLAAYDRVRAWRSTWETLAGVIVASPFVGDVLVGDGAPADSIAVVPYPVPPPEAVEPTRRCDVLYLGRLTVDKGVDVLLHALAELPDVTALIAGEGPDRPRLERLVEALDLGARVELVGWVSLRERAALLAGARALALTSRWAEAFGIVGVEAMGCGVPVVASDVGGIPSWLRDGEGGFLVPPGDSAALADGLRRVLVDGAERSRLVEAGRAAAASFSEARHVERLLATFGRVVPQHPVDA